MVVCRFCSAPSLPPGDGERLRPGHGAGGAVHERLGGAAEGDVERAVAVRVARRDLPELGELVEDEVALVEQVVGLAPDGHLLLDRLVERRELVGVGADVVAGVRRERGVLGRGGVREGAEAAVEVLQRAGEGLAAGDHGGLGGAVRRVGRQGAPGVPELAEQAGDRVVARLAELVLDARQAVGGGRLLAQRHVLGPVLQVQERVAHAAVLEDVDALAELRPGAAGEHAGGDRVRRRGAEDRLLAGVALGLRVGDVVRRDVEAALLREQAAQRRLQAGEGRDRGHACRSRTRCGLAEAGCAGAPAPGGA